MCSSQLHSSLEKFQSPVQHQPAASEVTAEWECMAPAERRRPSSRAAGGGMRVGAKGGSGKLQQARAAAAPGQGYFTAGLAALFLCLTALLVVLPLVLPPLPPPPLLLLLVPVALMAVLLVLAPAPSDGRSARGAVVASSCLY